MSGLVWPVADGRALRLPTKVLASHRDARWVWRVLNRRDQVVGELDGVTGGSLEMSVSTPIRGSGRVTWTGLLEDMPAWDQIRLKPVYTATFPNGESVEWPFGVYLPAVPRVTHRDGLVEAQVDLYDKTLILANDALGDDLALDKGADPVAHAFDQVVASINLLFEDWDAMEKPAFEDTAERLRTPIFWEIGTPIIRMVNDALQAAGWFAIWADVDGVLRSSKYVPPAQRAVVWDFNDLPDESIYTPEFDVTHDWFDAPNRVFAISQGDGDEPGMIAEASNMDEADPLSYWGRGRWVTRTEENVEATSQAVLDAYAARLLREGRTPRTVQLSHAPIPLAGNDRVSFSRSGVIDIPGVVTSWSVECDGAALMRTTVQEITP